MLYSEEQMRKKIKKLYETNPEIHLDISLTKPKLILKNAKAKIVGVYLHIFCIEEDSGRQTKRYSIRYADVMPGHIDVLELAQIK